MKNLETITHELSEIKLDGYSIPEIVTIEDGDNFEDIQERIETWIYEQEVIYYSVAMNYLMENDCSLNESMELAGDYDTTNINSELLATLLYQENLKSELSDIIDEIEEVFED